MNDLQVVMDQLLDHNEVLHNHADVLIEHDVRLKALEKVINAPAPEPVEVAQADAKIDEPEVGGEDGGEETPKEIKEDAE